MGKAIEWTVGECEAAIDALVRAFGPEPSNAYLKSRLAAWRAELERARARGPRILLGDARQ